MSNQPITCWVRTRYGFTTAHKYTPGSEGWCLWCGALKKDEKGEPAVSNSAPAASLPETQQQENHHMGIYNGYTFSTSNSTVKSAPVGTLFEKLSNGNLGVRFVPIVKVALTVKDLPEGTRVKTKYGAGEVVRLTSRSSVASLAGFNPSTQVLYVADVDSVVRFANAADLEKI